MKIKSILLALLSIFLWNITKAQTPFENADATLRNAKYIFDGEVVSQTFYRDSLGLLTFTSNRVKINKIYKDGSETDDGGDILECGEVLIVTHGSSGKWVDFGDGLYISDVTHVIQYGVGSKGTFFTNKNSPKTHSMPPSNPTNNSLVLMTFDFVNRTLAANILDTLTLETLNPLAQQYAGMQFDNMEQFYEFLAMYNLDTNNFVKCPQDEAQPLPLQNKDIKNDSTVKQDGIPKLPSKEERERNIKKRDEIMKERLKKKTIRRKTNVDFNYAIRNDKYTGTISSRYLEFDIMVSCNQTGIYLDNCPVHLSYNTNAFGDNIADNSKISLTKGSLFNTATYDDPNSFIADNAADEVAMHLGIDYAQPSLNRVVVPTVLTQMLHVKVEIAACSEISAIDFINKTNILGALTYTLNANEDPISGSIYWADDINFGGGLSDPLCLPIIDNFNNNVHAGTEDVLTINGRHFGDYRGNGQIKFKNADDGGLGDFLLRLDDLDYISWNDNQIEVYVPSQIDTLPNLSSAGSGPFVLSTNLGDETLSERLEILYSVSNSNIIKNTDNNYKKFRYNLVNTTTNNSYIFHCDSSVYNYPIRKAIVKKALKDWSCRTGVNWILGNDTIVLFGANNVSTISFSKEILKEKILGATFNRPKLKNTTNGAGYKAYESEIDIVFTEDFSSFNNSGAGWFYDTTGANIPNYLFDFYGVVLHELGHGHGLGHINDIDEIMYFEQKWGPSLGIYRNFSNAQWFNTSDGAIDVMNESISIQYASPVNAIVRVFPSNCGNLASVNQTVDIEEMAVYPNPTNDVVFLVTRQQLETEVSLHNSNGVLMNANIKPSENNIYEIDLSTLSSGIYFITMKNEERVIIKKVVKK